MTRQGQDNGKAKRKYNDKATAKESQAEKIT
jgi:hypothetical protein